MKWYYVVLDRDGGDIEVSDELFDTAAEAYKAGEFHVDDPRYGSHEAVSEGAVAVQEILDELLAIGEPHGEDLG